MAQRQEIPNGGQAWPQAGLTRVPYRVFQTAEAYKSEQQLIFQGPSWRSRSPAISAPPGLAIPR
jgi:anthranilate 1,2-dioxygenase large subunit